MRLHQERMVGFRTSVFGLAVILSAHALAAEDGGEGLRVLNLDTTSQVDLKVLGVEGDRQSFKFNEYRDLSTGIDLSGSARGEKDGYYTLVNIKDAGRKTQEYSISGNSYNHYKYNLYFKEIPHNLSLNDSTYFTGLGTNQLVDHDQPWSNGQQPLSGIGEPFPTVTAWSTPFDYTITRKNYGATFEAKNETFFGNFSASRELSDGIRPTGQMSCGELPVPISFANTLFGTELGYHKEAVFASVQYDLSNFINSNPYLFFQNPGLAGDASGTPPTAAGTSTVGNVNKLGSYSNYDGADVASIAPNSLDSRVGVKVAVGDLPLNSDFHFRASQSWTTTNDETLLAQGAATSKGKTTVYDTNIPFQGKVTSTSLGAALASRPAQNLDTKLFYKYFDHNNSTPTFGFSSYKSSAYTQYMQAGSGPGITTTNYGTSTYNYHKWNAGAEAGYRLPYSTRARVGYDYQATTRDRDDGNQSNENHYFVKLNNGYLDFMSIKARLDYLTRRTSAIRPDYAPDSPEQYFRAWDVADKNMIKANTGVDFDDVFVPNLSIGLEYNWKQNTYPDDSLGRSSDKLQEGYLSASYSIHKIQFSVFGDVEKENIEESHVYGTTYSPLLGSDNSPQLGNQTSFAWNNSTTDLYWGYGFNVAIPIVENKWDIHGSWAQDINSGGEAFTSNFPALINTTLDDTRHTVADIHATYHVNQKFTCSMGAMFDRQTYYSDQWNGYSLNPATVSFPSGQNQWYGGGYNANSLFLTGAQADKAYTAQVYYVSAQYKL